MERLLHAIRTGRSVDRRAGTVVDPVADHRPAVVGAGCRNVDLVPSLGSVLGQPHRPGLGVDRQPLRIAVAVAPDFGHRAGPADEGVVLGDAAVVVEPHDHAVVVGDVLRRVGGEITGRTCHAIAHREVEVAIGVEGQPAPVVPAALGHGLENLVHECETVVLEGAPDHRRRAAPAQIFPGLRVADVDHPVRSEVGVRHHVHQPALAAGHDLGHARDGVGKELAVAHDPKPAGAFRDQDIAARKERDRPGNLESLGHRNHPEVVKSGPHGARLGRNGGANGGENRAGEEKRHCTSHESCPLEPIGLWGVRTTWIPLFRRRG